MHEGQSQFLDDVCLLSTWLEFGPAPAPTRHLRSPDPAVQAVYGQSSTLWTWSPVESRLHSLTSPLFPRWQKGMVLGSIHPLFV